MVKEEVRLEKGKRGIVNVDDLILPGIKPKDTVKIKIPKLERFEKKKLK